MTLIRVVPEEFSPGWIHLTNADHSLIPEVWTSTSALRAEVRRREIEFPSLLRLGVGNGKWIPFEEYGREIGLILDRADENGMTA